jgi:serine/threonine protein kinase
MTVSTISPPVLLITHTDALPVGTRLSEFEVLGLLGVGGFGMVYQAFDHSLQRSVAIKEYLPVSLAGRAPANEVVVRDGSDPAAFQAGLQAFVAEARLLAQFDHPSLVKVFRYWEGYGTAYMVMPLYQGITLQAARRQMVSPPDEVWLRKVLWAILGALKTLHHGRAIHRDVSPDNIFLQDIGPPVLLDVGAARHASQGESQTGAAVFKLSYAALEQYAGTEDMRQGPWTDLYALAAVVHGLMCNKPPLPATFRAMRDRLPAVSRVADTVKEQFGLAYSPAFTAAVDQALAIRPQDRPQSVTALAQAMALETPHGMSRFDWRAELGAIWLPPGSMPAQPKAGTDIESEPQSSPEKSDSQTQRLPVRTSREKTKTERGAADARETRRPRRRWRAGIGALVLIMAGVSLAVLVGRNRPTPAVEVAAKVSAPAVVALPVAAPLVTTPSPAPPVVVASEEPAPRLISRRPVREKTNFVAIAESTLPRPITSALPVLAPKPALPATPATMVLPDPHVLCADSNFLTRPMCIYRQCQKPELADLAFCVENNSRMQKNRGSKSF